MGLLDFNLESIDDAVDAFITKQVASKLKVAQTPEGAALLAKTVDSLTDTIYSVAKLWTMEREAKKAE